MGKILEIEGLAGAVKAISATRRILGRELQDISVSNAAFLDRLVKQSGALGRVSRQTTHRAGDKSWRVLPFLIVVAKAAE